MIKKDDPNPKSNQCPVCKKKKVYCYLQYPLYVKKDILTGKEIFMDILTEKRIYKPSNQHLAAAYKAAQNDAQMWQYVCDNCGWISDTFVP